MYQCVQRVMMKGLRSGTLFTADLQIRRGDRDNSNNFFLFLNKNMV